MAQRRDSRVTRRHVLKAGAAASVAIASGVSAPAILAATNAPLRIGVLNTFSGPTASTGDWNWWGMGVYLDEIKETMAGRKVELIKEDDQFNPQIGLEKVRKFVESDKVDLIVGPQASNVALAVLNYIKQSKAFLLISGAGTDAVTWERIPYMFRSSLSSWQLCSPMAEWIYDNIAKEMVLMSEDYAGGRDVADEVKKPYLAKGGKITREIYVPTTVTDYSTGQFLPARYQRIHNLARWKWSGKRQGSSSVFSGHRTPNRYGIHYRTFRNRRRLAASVQHDSKPLYRGRRRNLDPRSAQPEIWSVGLQAPEQYLHAFLPGRKLELP